MMIPIRLPVSHQAQSAHLGSRHRSFRHRGPSGPSSVGTSTPYQAHSFHQANLISRSEAHRFIAVAPVCTGMPLGNPPRERRINQDLGPVGLDRKHATSW